MATHELPLIASSTDAHGLGQSIFDPTSWGHWLTFPATRAARTLSSASRRRSSIRHQVELSQTERAELKPPQMEHVPRDLIECEQLGGPGDQASFLGSNEVIDLAHVEYGLGS